MIPEPGNTTLTFTSFIILLGVVQGTLLSITGLLHHDRKSKLKGFLFLGITCIVTEIFLNRTGYMYHVIYLVDFSEPVQFAIPPLVYLIVLSLNPEHQLKRWGLHFIPFIFYFLYFLPFYLASPDYKEASYYYIHHLVNFKSAAEHNFLRSWGELRNFQLFGCFFQTTIYLVLSFQWLFNYKNRKAVYTGVNTAEVNWWIFFNVTLGLLIIVVLTVKVSFARDLGDHIIASFLTFIIYLATFAELLRLGRTEKRHLVSAEEPYTLRAVSTVIKDDKKEEIRKTLVMLMEEKRLYRDSLVSLSRIAKHTGEPSYIVSMVINEKFEASFFEWIAKYRVEEAKLLLLDPSKKMFTIEQVAEEVGYNSKSAFNKVFKKYTGKTPSEYRNA